MNKKQKGFSLIELLIVVAIILIIAAIAIPNLLRAQMAAHEASAVGTLRTLNTSTVTYQSTYGNGFAPNLTVLGGAIPATCDNANLVDNTISVAPNQKSGYTFSLIGLGTPVNAPAGCGTAGVNAYTVGAVPITTGTTGQRTFCSDESGVIRFDPAGGAAPGTDVACQALSALQ
ncbi:MAG: prepilin-type N-terminal cleavage/methylation domain-containing protein [Candidatus Acidiferrales bacterium]